MYSTAVLYCTAGTVRRSTSILPSSLGSDRDGAGEDAVLQQDAEDEEHKVQCEHGEAQHSAHLPATGCDGDDDKEEHEEQQHDGAEEAIRADSHRLAAVKQSVDKPGHWQAATEEDRYRCVKPTRWKLKEDFYPTGVKFN